MCIAMRSVIVFVGPYSGKILCVFVCGVIILRLFQAIDFSTTSFNCS